MRCRTARRKDEYEGKTAFCAPFKDEAAHLVVQAVQAGLPGETGGFDDGTVVGRGLGESEGELVYLLGDVTRTRTADGAGCAVGEGELVRSTRGAVGGGGEEGPPGLRRA